MEHVDNCPVCLADARGAPVVHARPRDSLLRCPACRSLFSNPRYTRDELAELYLREYYGPSPGDGSAGALPGRAVQENADLLHRAVLSAIRRRFPQAVRPGARLLDYGCGLGGFLAEARRQGLDGMGLELSPQAVEHARGVLGLDVRVGEEPALAELPEASFDLVVSWEVLEHTLQPRRTLELLAGRLRPGGVLGISTPNLGCWRYRLEGGRWFNIANPTHLNLVPPATLRGLLKELGLTRVRRAVFWGGRAGFGPVRNLLQYAFRAMNLGSDLRLFAVRPGN